MYKKILLVVLGCILISGVCLAKTSDIECEIENPASVEYIMGGVSGTSGTRYFKFFVKSVDNQGNEEYWLKVFPTTEDRMLYFSSLIIDAKEYPIYSINELKKRHLQAGKSIATNSWYGAYDSEYYEIPNDVINALKDAKTPVTFIFNRHKKQGDKVETSDIYMNKIKTIIGLTYADKDEYWQPNLAK